MGVHISKYSINELNQLEIMLDESMKRVRETKQRVMRDLNDKTMCKICEENEKQVVFLPCGHFCTCFDCSERIENCPLCRGAIIQKVKTFT